MSQVKDLYPNLPEFESLLDDARMSAQTDREEEFVQTMRENYQLYRGRMYLSEAQDNWLRKIAGPDD